MIKSPRHGEGPTVSTSCNTYVYSGSTVERLSDSNFTLDRAALLKGLKAEEFAATNVTFARMTVQFEKIAKVLASFQSAGSAPETPLEFNTQAAVALASLRQSLRLIQLKTAAPELGLNPETKDVVEKACTALLSALENVTFSTREKILPLFQPGSALEMGVQHARDTMFHAIESASINPIAPEKVQELAAQNVRSLEGRLQESVRQTSLVPSSYGMLAESILSYQFCLEAQRGWYQSPEQKDAVMKDLAPKYLQDQVRHPFGHYGSIGEGLWTDRFRTACNYIFSQSEKEVQACIGELHELGLVSEPEALFQRLSTVDRLHRPTQNPTSKKAVEVVAERPVLLPDDADEVGILDFRPINVDFVRDLRKSNKPTVLTKGDIRERFWMFAKEPDEDLGVGNGQDTIESFLDVMKWSDHLSPKEAIEIARSVLADYEIRLSAR